MTDQTQIGGFSAFFVISVVKNPFTFGIPASREPTVAPHTRRAAGYSPFFSGWAEKNDEHPTALKGMLF